MLKRKVKLITPAPVDLIGYVSGYMPKPDNIYLMQAEVVVLIEPEKHRGKQVLWPPEYVERLEESIVHARDESPEELTPEIRKRRKAAIEEATSGKRKKKKKSSKKKRKKTKREKLLDKLDDMSPAEIKKFKEELQKKKEEET